MIGFNHEGTKTPRVKCPLRGTPEPGCRGRVVCTLLEPLAEVPEPVMALRGETTKAGGSVWGKGSDYGKMLSPNKPDTEPTPTPYAAYPARRRHAIRSRSSAGTVPPAERRRRTTEPTNAVADGGGFPDSAGPLAQRTAGLERPSGQGSCGAGDSLHRQSDSEPADHARPDRPSAGG